MGEAFFNCGLWIGEITSASRFFVVLDEIEARHLTAEREGWRSMVVAPIRQQLQNLTLRRIAGEPDDTQQCLDLGLDIAAALVHPLRRYVDDQLRGIYDGDPCAMDVWDLPDGLGDANTAWCAIDLLKACTLSAERRCPVRVYFDSLDCFSYRWP